MDFTVCSTKSLFAVISAAVLIMTTPCRADANGAIADIPFANLGRDGKFDKSLFVYNAGRIAIDASWIGPAELTLTLFRPGGAEASQISGTGGSLTLTYAVTQREVDHSLATADVKWRIEISRPGGTGVVGGRLKIAYPYGVVNLLQNKPFEIAALGKPQTARYTHTESFNLLSPGTIRLRAKWDPKTRLSVVLNHKKVGTVEHKEGEGAFEISHQVNEETLNAPQWSCTLRNLSRQKVSVTLSITFIPDR